jgi:transcriptional regulator of acetoin/glycerol metabolism
MSHTLRVLQAQEGLALTETHAGSDGGDARSPLASRWARAASLGAKRDGDAYPVGSGDADLVQRRARFDDVITQRRMLLDPLARHLASTACCAIVADPDGIILSSHAASGFDDPAARVRLVPGADWSERARGTNAIGTAIAEQSPVAVIGKAHYEQRNEVLFCYAAPVFEATGALAAVLDVSGAIEHDDPSVWRSVREAAAAVERALRELAYARAGFRNLALLERLVSGASAPTFLVEPRGPVRMHNDAAAKTLLHGRTGLDCHGIFGADFSALAEMAREGREARFEARGESFRVRLDPIVDPSQRPLGIVVHLEPEARRAISVAPPASADPDPPLPAPFDTIHATDAGVVAAKRLAATFAPTTIPVLLLAETGTGKELFARAIHASSDRAAGPCVAINCGALSPALLESELFGYAPGAFTGAGRAGSNGLLGEADGGTLFLDEIAEMPEPLQAALLRALEDGTYRRLGDPRPRRSSFRLVAATCRDLAARVEQGSFRSDLFYRIHGACVRIPPVRERSDRVSLARALVAQQRPTSPPELSPSAVRHLEAHVWPGNVRELKSAVIHALALCGPGPLEQRHFPEPLIGHVPTGVAERPGGGRTRRQVLRDTARETLRATGGNVSEAARRLGVARDTLYRMLRRG